MCICVFVVVVVVVVVVVSGVGWGGGGGLQCQTASEKQQTTINKHNQETERYYRNSSLIDNTQLIPAPKSWLWLLHKAEQKWRNKKINDRLHHGVNLVSKTSAAQQLKLDNKEGCAQFHATVANGDTKSKIRKKKRLCRDWGNRPQHVITNYWQTKD